MIKEIKKINSSFFNLPFIGDKNYEVRNIAGLHSANYECLSFYSGNDIERLKTFQVGILIVSNYFEKKISDFKSKTIIFAQNPKFEFLNIIAQNYSNTFEINPNTNIKYNNSKIAPSAFIESNVKIGEYCQIFPNVCIYNETKIGNNCDIQSGSVIGGIGLGDIWENNRYNKFVQLGDIIIEDNVSIGCNSSIMKGMLESTIIGQGTKIANNVNIGHSVVIGKNCYISSGVTIGGACIIEDNCWIAIGTTINDHVCIKQNSKIGTGSVIIKDTIQNGFYLGNPARYISERTD